MTLFTIYYFSKGASHYKKAGKLNYGYVGKLKKKIMILIMNKIQLKQTKHINEQTKHYQLLCFKNTINYPREKNLNDHKKAGTVAKNQ